MALVGHKADQVLLKWISLSDSGLLAELFHCLLCFFHVYADSISTPCTLLYSVPLVNNAHAVRTFLLANATAALPYPARWINANNHWSLTVFGSFTL